MLQIFLLVGILVNEAINMTLKRLIREPRPVFHGRSLPSSYGMPSDHSQCMTFFSCYAVLFLIFRSVKVKVSSTVSRSLMIDSIQGLAVNEFIEL